MKTIAFFSIKGGTGRSLALANIAAFYSKNGKRVGCVDFDIMAPGLFSILKVPEEILKNKKSVIDLLLNLGNPEFLVNSIIDVGEILGMPKNYLFLIPARPEPKKKYQELAKGNTFQVRTMNIFKNIYLNTFASIKNLDYLFIDARSGLAEESLCALSLIKRFIILFTRLDSQSREVTYHFLNLLNEYKYRLQPLIVASNVPSGKEEFVVGEFSFKISKEAVGCLEDLNNELSTLNLRINCIIPFEEMLLLQHKIVTLDDLSSSLSQSYLNLAQIIENLPED